jgi:hypothetical protein
VRPLKTFGLAVGLGLSFAVAQPATAADFIFNLSGTPSGTDPIDFTVTPFEVAAGDAIKVQVDLTSNFTVPHNPGDYVLFFEALLTVPLDTPPGNQLTSDTSFKMLDGDLAGLTGYSGCGNCIFSAFGEMPSATPFSFSSFYTEMNVLNLVAAPGQSLPETVTGFRLSLAYFLPPPSVPEPTSWALMISGFALAGAALRRAQARPAVLRA